MSLTLDLILVTVCVALALGYLVRRNVRSLAGSTREWSTGHTEHACHSCPIIEIRKLQQTRGS